MFFNLYAVMRGEEKSRAALVRGGGNYTVLPIPRFHVYLFLSLFFGFAKVKQKYNKTLASLRKILTIGLKNLK
jgi:hypothetical protein